MRMTQGIRNALYRALTEVHFNAQWEARRKQEEKVGEEVYRQITRSFARVLRRLPVEWVRQGNQFSVKAANGSHKTLMVRTVRPMPRDVIPAKMLTVRCQRMVRLNEDANAALRDEHAQVRTDLYAVMEDCVTTEELVARWPQVGRTVERVLVASFASVGVGSSRTQRQAIAHPMHKPTPPLDLVKLGGVLGLPKVKARGRRG